MDFLCFLFVSVLLDFDNHCGEILLCEEVIKLRKLFFGKHSKLYELAFLKNPDSSFFSFIYNVERQ